MCVQDVEDDDNEHENNWKDTVKMMGYMMWNGFLLGKMAISI